ncbi:hypothetical protein [Alteromonas sp. ASW11-130]|uniref:hypothetical protein n=1 Tax=Alteromonas sp. ASW11-130 TaxID=3015775 RepID=UPI0022429B72|nr:hypothetical protein [Alteromonas sp. ASW11-130]MCW8092323.1 hypothetical protein [Alteromonas sp. ASW11-130]
MTSIKDTAKLPEQGPLHQVNQTFHQRYAERKQCYKEAILTGDYHLVVRMDDRLISIIGGNTTEHVVVGKDYHEIKAATHLPLLLMFAQDQREILDYTRTYKGETNLPIIRKLFSLIEDWATNTKENKFTDISMLKTDLAPIFAQIMDVVAKQEIKKTVHTLNEIKSRVSIPLDKTFFVVFGSHQARYKQLGKMIIKKWLRRQIGHYGHIEHHVRYCEGAERLEDAIDIVCTALVDNELAHLFLGEQYALNQDVVTQTAERHLSQFWPTDV